MILIAILFRGALLKPISNTSTFTGANMMSLDRTVVKWFFTDSINHFMFNPPINSVVFRFLLI
ncbi:hypothetical protein BCN_C1_15 (plasmid) [Bacillus cereus NC7401]|nr:hypothetical protein BCN_C1_15 [Bacillus cereus NC7401]